MRVAAALPLCGYHFEYLETGQGLLDVGLQSPFPSGCLLRSESLGCGGSGSSLLRHDGDGPDDESNTPSREKLEWGQFRYADYKQHCSWAREDSGELKGCVTLVAKIRKEEIAFDFDLFFWSDGTLALPVL